MSKDNPDRKDDANCPPPTEAPRDATPPHPVGTGVGAVAGGATAGAAIGSVAGPIGTAVGAAVGTLAGAVAGRAIAEKIDPDETEAYWCEMHRSRPGIRTDLPYDDYRPAYRYGAEMSARHGGRGFDAVEGELAAGWTAARGASRLDWPDARQAARDAWERARKPAADDNP